MFFDPFGIKKRRRIKAKNTIRGFYGNYQFLHNDYDVPVTIDGITYRCNMSAYEAQKISDYYEKKKFADLDGLVAYELGKRIKTTDDFEENKLNIMKKIVYAKFVQNEELKRKLLDTGDKILICSNYYGDKFYGVVEGKGKNHLGKILMEVRDELRRESSW